MRRRTRALPAVLAVLAAIALSGCGGDGDAETSGVVDVTIDTFQFSPDPLEVEAGTTVRFTNEDPTTHTVTAGTRDEPDPDRFDEPLAEGESAEITFDERGRVPYFCRIHSGPGMTAEVVVS
jgi:plastocyanin